MSVEKKDLWYYYHAKIKKRLGPFSTEALCNHLLKEQVELEHIMLCQTGWKNWKCGLNVPEFISFFQNELASFDNLLPPIIETETQAEVQIKPDIIASPAKENINKRKHARVELELKVVFISGKKTFRTKTVDLSLGGIKTIDPLPEIYFNTPIEVFISSPDLKISIKFSAILVANANSSTHIQFTGGNDIGQKHLESWLNSVYKNQAKQISKPLKKTA
jgi:hypothetical protein